MLRTGDVSLNLAGGSGGGDGCRSPNPQLQRRDSPRSRAGGECDDDVYDDAAAKPSARRHRKGHQMAWNNMTMPLRKASPWVVVLLFFNAGVAIGMGGAELAYHLGLGPTAAGTPADVAGYLHDPHGPAAPADAREDDALGAVGKERQTDESLRSVLTAERGDGDDLFGEHEDEDSVVNKALRAYREDHRRYVDEELMPLKSAAERRQAVRGMFLHAWSGYRAHAWGADELRPGVFPPQRPQDGMRNTFGGWGATLVDALDTLAILGLEKELDEAREYVATKLNYSAPHMYNPESQHPTMTSMFELCIRHLGGLLGAYTLTQDPLYKEKAEDVGRRLLPGFVGPKGFAVAQLDLASGRANQFDAWPPCLAELGSLQLEMTYLSMITGNRTFARVANRFYEHLYDERMANRTGESTARRGRRHRRKRDGSGDDGSDQPLFDPMLYSQYSTTEGDLTGDVMSIGGQSDSFYEYLLKVYLLTGAEEEWLREMYASSADAVDAMLREEDGHGHTYITLYRGRPTHEMDHLSCFVGGMLVLGAQQADRRAHTRDVELAVNVTDTCYELYRASSTGLGPEIAMFDPCTAEREGGAGRQPPCEPPQAVDSRYQLRPETLESIYYLWLETKDPKYRDWAWDIFLAIERNCRLPIGYTAVSGAHREDILGPKPEFIMESFFLAETIKYLYLIFLDDSPVPFDDYVLSTEAHPFRRRPKKE